MKQSSKENKDHYKRSNSHGSPPASNYPKNSPKTLPKQQIITKKPINNGSDKIKVKKSKTQQEFDRIDEIKRYVFNFKPEEIARLPQETQIAVANAWISYQLGSNKKRETQFNITYGKAIQSINMKILNDAQKKWNIKQSTDTDESI